MEPEHCGFSSLAACWILGVFCVFCFLLRQIKSLRHWKKEMLQMQESTHLFEVALPESQTNEAVCARDKVAQGALGCHYLC